MPLRAEENRSTHSFSKSLIYVAKFHLDRGGGDFPRARAYAERVAQSNAEEVTIAAELVRRMNAAGILMDSAGVQMPDGLMPGISPQTGGTDAMGMSTAGTVEGGVTV